MKKLKDYIIEGHSFLVNKKLKNRQQEYEYYPQNKEELRNIIINLLKNGITDLNCIDVSKITDMRWLFSFVNVKITVSDIDISEWDVSNVSNMGGMFSECDKFNSNLSEWNVSNVNNMNSMFDECHKFNCDLSKWDVSNVTSMSCMFSECDKFNSDLSKWKVDNVKFMNSMFDECKEFNADLSNWDVSNVKYMNSMFMNCDMLKKNNLIPKWYKGKV